MIIKKETCSVDFSCCFAKTDNKMYSILGGRHRTIILNEYRRNNASLNIKVLSKDNVIRLYAFHL